MLDAVPISEPGAVGVAPAVSWPIRLASALIVLAAGASLAPIVSTAGHGARPMNVRRPAVPILMYHVIADPRPRTTYPELFVNPADFEGQMDWLVRNGYTAVTLRAVWDHWRGHGQLPSRPVVVTFDDGYRSIATRAAPVLRTRRWPGVLNLDVSNIDQEQGFGEGQIRGLLRSGWELDSHTLTHPDLTALDAASLRRETAGSRRWLSKTFGVPVDFFCYPSGRLDDRVVAAVKGAGYLGATTTVYGLAHPGDPYRLARVRVSRSDGVKGFAAKMSALAPR